jgi:CRISPR-associated protein Cas1
VALRLHLRLASTPALPLSPGHLRRWGLWFLLHAAIGKPLHRHLTSLPAANPDVQVALHPANAAPAQGLRQGQTFEIDVFLSTHGTPCIESLLLFLRQHLGGDNPVQLDNITPLPPPPAPPLPLPPAPLPPDTPAPPCTQVEIALDFDTPLPFQRHSDSRTRLSPDTLGRMLVQRARQVWGPAAAQALQAEWAAQPDAHLLCGYWKFVDIPRASASQNRNQPAAARRERLRHTATPQASLHLQHHSGCLGRLYVRSASPNLLAWLLALAPWHLHSSAGVAVWGQYSATAEPQAWFDPQLPDVPALVTVAEATFRAYDVPPGYATHLPANHTRHQRPAAPQTEAEMALLLAQDLTRGTWQPDPTEGFSIPKANGRPRLVERLGLRDLVAHKRLGGLLAPVLDASFSANSLGYRKGLSRHDATTRIRQLLREGHRWVVEADIEDFFPSADHARIEAALDRVLPRADTTLRTLLGRALRTPCLRADHADSGTGTPPPRSQGLAQGAPLSPLLANLLLDGLDQALEPVARDAMVRYADDFVLLARTQAQAEQLLHQVTTEVARLGLRLSADKTHITRVEDGFDFLGEHFDNTQLEDPLTTDAGQRKPMVITDSYLHLGLNGQALDIRRDNKLIDTVPLRRISELVVFGRNSLSTALMQRLAEHKVPVSIALNGGYQIAVLHPDSRRYHEIAWHQSRWYHALDDTARLSIAQAFLDAKLNGYHALVRKRSPICQRTVGHIDRALEALGECTTIDQLRGHEGLAARATFAWLQTQFRPDVREHFQSARRGRGGPDRLNSLLNFGYYLSYTRLNGLVRAHGLNPYLGFLHDSLDDYETLVADLQELVRPFVDRLVIQLVNVGHIGPNSFEDTPRGLYLSKPAARTMAREFERAMGQRVINQRLGDMLVTQVRQLRAFMCESAPLWLFHMGLQDGTDLHPGHTNHQVSDADEDADDLANDDGTETTEPDTP